MKVLGSVLASVAALSVADGEPLSVQKPPHEC
jgi:hypothetical protein